VNRGLWLLAVLLSAAGAAAEPRLILDAGVGAVYGETTELVLRDGTYQNPISRLVWPTPPSVAAEAGARIAWTDWTSTEARLRSAWQTRPGTIVDEDWNAGSLVYGRSEHSAYLTSLVEVEANQRLTWGPLDLLVGGRYRWASWEAWDGQGTYQYTAGTNKNSFRGAVLDYRQMWLLPYAGLGLTGKAFGVRWNPEIRLGPYTWCLDRDDHNYAAVKDGYEVSSLAFLDYPVGGGLRRGPAGSPLRLRLGPALDRCGNLGRRGRHGHHPHERGGQHPLRRGARRCRRLVLGNVSVRLCEKLIHRVFVGACGPL